MTLCFGKPVQFSLLRLPSAERRHSFSGRICWPLSSRVKASSHRQLEGPCPLVPPFLIRVSLSGKKAASLDLGASQPGLCAGKGRETFRNLQDMALETAIIAHLFIPERKLRCSDGECHSGAAFRRPHSAARTMDVEGAHSLTWKAICFTSKGRIHEGDSGQCCRGPCVPPGPSGFRGM